MKFKEIILKAEGDRKLSILPTPVSYKIFRVISYYIVPIFLKLKISANAITFFSLVLSILSALAIISGSTQGFIAGILLYFAAIICDYIDGGVARATNTTTFFGKFYDGLVGIAAVCIIRLALVYLVFTKYQVNALIWAGMFCLVLTPWQHFIFDRYSAYARWINTDKKLNIAPYIRRNFSPKIANVVEDLELPLLILSLFLFSPGMWIYF